MCCGMHLNIYEQEVFKILKNNVELFLELKINNFCLKKKHKIFFTFGKTQQIVLAELRKQEGEQVGEIA